MPVGHPRCAQSQLERLDGAGERAAGRLRLDRFGRDATIVGDLEQPASREIHGGEGSLLQADPFKPSKLLPQLFVHAPALDVPRPIRRRVCLTGKHLCLADLAGAALVRAVPTPGLRCTTAQA
ncbi:hypothetical protein ABIC08_004221 [Bradyrhizobium sp. RT9b]